MKQSIIVARSENGVIGAEGGIPWLAKGEQLLFKALTFNQWLLAGRKTYEAMGLLPNRKHAIVSTTVDIEPRDDVRVFPSIDAAFSGLRDVTDHVMIAGGGQVFASTVDQVDVIHLSTVHIEVDGDVIFPPIPRKFQKVFSQRFTSNLNYTYEIWTRGDLTGPL